MQTEFARDLADQNRPIEDAVTLRPGKAIKVRIQPMILTGNQYRAWKDVRWTLECEAPAEAFALRDAMVAFFQALAARGPEAVQQQLAAASTEAHPTAGAA